MPALKATCKNEKVSKIIQALKNPKGRSDFTFSQVKSLLFNSNSFLEQELNTSELGYR